MPQTSIKGYVALSLARPKTGNKLLSRRSCAATSLLLSWASATTMAGTEFPPRYTVSPVRTLLADMPWIVSRSASLTAAEPVALGRVLAWSERSARNVPTLSRSSRSSRSTDSSLSRTSPHSSLDGSQRSLSSAAGYWREAIWLWTRFADGSGSYMQSSGCPRSRQEWQGVSKVHLTLRNRHG